MTSRLAFVVVAVAPVCTGCAPTQPLREGQKLVETCARPSLLELSGRWNPERSEINRLEMRLPAVLGKALAQGILEEPETLPRTSDYYRKLSFGYTAWALGNPRVLTDERG